jgi:hypothetical protein
LRFPESRKTGWLADQNNVKPYEKIPAEYRDLYKKHSSLDVDN